MKQREHWGELCVMNESLDHYGVVTVRMRGRHLCMVKKICLKHVLYNSYVATLYTI